MQPKSIQRFDLAFLASMVVYAVSFFLGYDDTVALTREQYAKGGLDVDPSMWIAALFGVVVAVYVLLWWLISLKRNNIAKWIFTIFFAVGLVLAVLALATGSAGPLTIAAILSLVSTALSGVAVFFLFRPDAKAWLERETPQG